MSVTPPPAIWDATAALLRRLVGGEVTIIAGDGVGSTVVTATAVTAASPASSMTIECGSEHTVVIAIPAAADGSDVVAETVRNVMALAIAAEAARCRDIERSDFLDRLQHALRTPLTALMGMGDLAETYWDNWDDAVRREVVRDSRIAAEHLYSLTDTLTDPLMIASSGWHPELTDVDLARVVADAVDDVGRHRGELAPVIIDVGPMPGAAGDARCLAQAIAALIDNAICFAAEAAEVTVAAWHEPAAARVVIEVTNRGDTIPADRLDRSFDAFVRGTAAGPRRYNGLGMGLTVARRVARAHSGDVTLASENGVTTARLTLPTRDPGAI